MAKLNWIKKQQGQLLIEAMVAVSLMLVGLLGIFGVLSRSLGLSRVAADQFVAVNLASEGIEIAKNILDKNFLAVGASWNAGFFDGEEYYVDYRSEGLGDCTTDELYFTGQGFYECNPVGNTKSKFKRVLEVAIKADGNMVAVKSTVNWTARGGLNSDVTVEDHFYNWRKP